MKIEIGMLLEPNYNFKSASFLASDWLLYMATSSCLYFFFQKIQNFRFGSNWAKEWAKHVLRPLNCNRSHSIANKQILRPKFNIIEKCLTMTFKQLWHSSKSSLWATEGLQQCLSLCFLKKIGEKKKFCPKILEGYVMSSRQIKK